MIARIWKGAVRTHSADAYAEYMQNTGIAGYASTPGNRGVWMLRRDAGENTEVLMFSSNAIEPRPTTWWSLTSRRSRASRAPTQVR